MITSTRTPQGGERTTTKATGTDVVSILFSWVLERTRARYGRCLSLKSGLAIVRDMSNLVCNEYQVGVGIIEHGLQGLEYTWFGLLLSPLLPFTTISLMYYHITGAASEKDSTEISVHVLFPYCSVLLLSVISIADCLLLILVLAPVSVSPFHSVISLDWRWHD